VELVSYSDYAVRLVNSADPQPPHGDALTDMASLRSFLIHLPAQRARATRRDLAALRLLRNRLRAVFDAVDADRTREAINRLNALLAEHPIRPQISGHDDSDWHLHLTERGDVAARYAANAVMGLSVLVTELGVERLGVCDAQGCRRVFVDTSTNRSRRYCSERCATRANVAAYRARQKQASTGTGRGR
jgi:predicted RNA-binding Zn ribbon-like protein